MTFCGSGLATSLAYGHGLYIFSLLRTDIVYLISSYGNHGSSYSCELEI